jgi:hypothetical protein
LVQRLAECTAGEELILEYKCKGVKGFIEVLSVNGVASMEVGDDDENEDNQDGSVNICYIIHPMTVEEAHASQEPTQADFTQEKEPAFTQGDIDDILGDKEPVDTKDIPF